MDLKDSAFRESIELAEDAVIVTESQPINKPGPKIVYVNNAFSKLSGYKPSEVMDKNPRMLQGRRHQP